VKPLSVLRCAVTLVLVLPFLTALTAQRVKVESTDLTEVVVEIYFAERLPELMFLSHKDPRYFVVGFEAFEAGEGIVFPTEGGGFLTELSLKKEGNLVLLRARSEKKFKHKVLYSKDEKRYRIVLTAEGPAPPANEKARDVAGKGSSGTLETLITDATGPAKADRFELERVIFEKSGIALVFRGDPPRRFYVRALPLEAEAVQIIFPDVTVAPAGELARRAEDLRCHREAGGTSCTVFLKNAPELSRKMTIRMISAETEPETGAPPTPAALMKPEPVAPDKEPPAPRDETKEGKTAESLPEGPAPVQGNAETIQGEVTLTGATNAEARPEEPVSPVEIYHGPPANEKNSEATQSEGPPEEGVSGAKEPEAPLHPEAPVATEEPARTSQEAAAPLEPPPRPGDTTSETKDQPAPSEGSAASPSEVVEVPASSGASVSPPVQSPPISGEKVSQKESLPALENPWTATLEGDLKQITYERSPDQSLVKLTFTKGPDFVAHARVSEVLITALNVASDILRKEFAEGPVASIDISPDLSGVQIVIQVRNEYEAQLTATGKDIVLRLTKKSSSAVPETATK